MSKNELQTIFDSSIQLSYSEKVKEIEEYIFSVANGKTVVGKPGEVAYPSFWKYKHSFAEGMYIREMTMPKSNLVVSAIHKRSFPFFLLSGHLAISTEKGVEEFIAPCYIITQSGTKRVGYSITDCVIVAVFSNPKNITDINELDKQNVAFTWAEYDKYKKNKDEENK